MVARHMCLSACNLASDFDLARHLLPSAKIDGTWRPLPMNQHRRQLESKTGTYRLRQRVGEGTFGVTYLAEWKEADRQVIVKPLKVEHLEDWKGLELFEHDPRVLAERDHSKIPAYLEYFPRSDGETSERWGGVSFVRLRVDENQYVDDCQ